MAKVVACIIARTVSTRLPLKVLRSIDSKYGMLDYIIQRAKLVKGVDAVYLCTSEDVKDDIMEDVAQKNGVKLYRGAADEVIERIIAVGDIEKADYVIRITGDNVFTAPEYLEKQIEDIQKHDLDYLRVVNVPIGATAEVMKLSAVKKCYSMMDPAVSEYLLLYMFQPAEFKCGVVNPENLGNYGNYTLTVDNPEDLIRTKEILKNYSGDSLKITLKEIIQIIEKHNIANSRFEASGEIKLPYNKMITFAEFKADMDDRASRSKQFIY